MALTGYRVASVELLEDFMRMTLGISKREVKASEDLAQNLRYLTIGIKAVVENDFDNWIYDPEYLEGAIEASGTGQLFRTALRKLSRYVWKEVRPKIFDDLYSAPTAELLVTRLTAMVVTRPNLIDNGSEELTFREPTENRIVRTQIAEFINPRIIKNRHQLAAFIFLINCAINEVREEAVVLMPRKARAFYTHALRDSVCPHCSPKEVKALFRAQQLSWQNGKIFGVDRVDPMPSEIYYNLMKALVTRAKKIEGRK